MYGLACTLTVVTATHKTQRSIVEALETETYAIHSELQQQARKLRCYVVGVQLDGNLSSLVDAETLAQHAENLPPMLRAEHRRCSATEINCREYDIVIAGGEGNSRARAHLAKKRFDIAVEKSRRPCGNGPWLQGSQLGVT